MERVRGKVGGGRSEKVRGGGKVRERVRGGKIRETKTLKIGLLKAFQGPIKDLLKGRPRKVRPPLLRVHLGRLRGPRGRRRPRARARALCAPEPPPPRPFKGT